MYLKLKSSFLDIKFKKLIIPVAATSATASSFAIYLATKTENEELKKLEEDNKKQNLQEQKKGEEFKETVIEAEIKEVEDSEETEEQAKEKKDEILRKKAARVAKQIALNDILKECKGTGAMRNRVFWNNKYSLLKNESTSFNCSEKTITLWNAKKYSDNNLEINDIIAGSTKRWWPHKDEILIFISISDKKR